MEIFQMGLEAHLDALVGEIEEIKRKSRRKFKSLKKEFGAGQILLRKAESLYKKYKKLHANILEDVEEIEQRTRERAAYLESIKNIENTDNFDMI